MAWLHATPKPDPRSKRAKSAEQAPAVSRIEAMRAQKIVPQLPPNSAPHIIERLIEIGLTEAAGMGVAPISWQAINAWQRLTSIDLPPWEARLLRALSVAYVAEGRAAEAETCPPPWLASASKGVIDAELRTLDAVLG